LEVLLLRYIVGIRFEYVDAIKRRMRKWLASEAKRHADAPRQ